MRGDRDDPYRNFKFRLRWDGREVAGFSRLDAPVLPGAAITLDRGVTHDPKFAAWMGASRKEGREAGATELEVEVLEEAGRRLTAFRARCCRVSFCLALPYVDARSVAIRKLRLENEGWEEGSPPAR